MANSDKVSLAALISVILRRKINRTIDVVWLISNEVYAREIIQLCHAQGLTELSEYADHLNKVMFGVDVPAASNLVNNTAAQPAKEVTEQNTLLRDSDSYFDETEEDVDESINKVSSNKYVGGLR
ncbi:MULTISPECIES: hypothetical protein [Methylotenera]|uniref:hypothetical protein n=1 Tax=Methylotenera TaxID=359407 RepID=UPI00036373B6|nr:MULTISPECIES: hypothetical protein [Methylotenera]